MLSCINDIFTYTSNMNSADFLNNKLVQDATIRNLEIIGEAAKSIPDSFRSQYPYIPWKKMSGMRDKLIHNYMGVDIWAVWVVVEDILPTLKLELEKTINP